MTKPHVLVVLLDKSQAVTRVGQCKTFRIVRLILDESENAIFPPKAKEIVNPVYTVYLRKIQVANRFHFERAEILGQFFTGLLDVSICPDIRVVKDDYRTRIPP